MLRLACKTKIDKIVLSIPKKISSYFDYRQKIWNYIALIERFFFFRKFHDLMYLLLHARTYLRVHVGHGQRKSLKKLRISFQSLTWIWNVPRCSEFRSGPVVGHLTYNKSLRFVSEIGGAKDKVPQTPTSTICGITP